MSFALQSVIYINAKLSTDSSPKSSEILNNNLSPYNQNQAFNVHSPHELNGIEIQLTSADDQDDIKADENRGNHNSDDELRAGSEREKVEKQKCEKMSTKDAEMIKEKEYLQSNAVEENKEATKHNNNKYKITTKTSHMKQTNALGDQAVTAKANAGVAEAATSIRVKNDLHKVVDINETSRNHMKSTTTIVTKTIIQNTKAASLTSNRSTTAMDGSKSGAASGNGGANVPQPLANEKLYHANGFPNPFGQLVGFFGGEQLHLQDYTFFFNAERHTVFQLHTNNYDDNNNNHNNNNKNNINQLANRSIVPGPSITTGGGGRLLNVVTDSIGAVFGVNTPAAGTTSANTSAASAASAATSSSSIRSPTINVEEVQLYNGKSLRQSRFNPFNPTRILIHGWFGGANSGVFQTLVPAYLRQGAGNYNVFTVDWGRGAVADYLTASYRVKPVGKVVAKFIDFLQREAGIRYEDLHVIGFSMGAHIAGIAGKHLQTGRLPIIYALDPALPFFRYDNFDERVVITDADYVEVVHTSIGSYGYDRPLGHVDFYVNYGSAQPGCFLNECSHMRAHQIFAESLQSKASFVGQGCDVKLWRDLVKQKRCLMGTGRQMLLGGDPLNVTALRGRGGVFYLTTNAVPPYAKDVT